MNQKKDVLAVQTTYPHSHTLVGSLSVLNGLSRAETNTIFWPVNQPTQEAIRHWDRYLN
jgi:hypothetical protein